MISNRPASLYLQLLFGEVVFTFYQEKIMIRILHVDDERAEHLLLKYNLDKIDKSITLDWVDSGRKVLDELDINKFDCIVCDYQMPGMNGFELHKKLANRGLSIPFIFRTGQGSEKLAAEALRAGVTDYFTKGEGFAHYERFYNSIRKHIEASQEKKRNLEAQEKIAQSEKLLSQSHRIALLGAYILDVKKGEWSCSDTQMEIFGIDKNYNFSIQGWLDLIHPDDKERMSSYFFSEVIEKKKTFENQYRIISKKDNKIRWIYDKAEITTDEKGNVAKLLGTIQDITQDERIKNELEESRNTLENIFNSSTPICIASKNFEIVKANEAYRDTFNLDFNEDIRKKCFEIRPGDLCHTNDCPITQILGGAPQAWEELQRPNKEGENRWYIATAKPVFDSDRNIIGIVENYQDITSLKNAQIALERSERRFRALFENIHTGVAIYKPTEDGTDFVIIDINRTAELWDKFDRKDVLGKRVTEVFPGVMEFGLLEIFKDVNETGKSQTHPISLYQDNKLRVWRENYVYKLPSGEIVAIYRDLTDLKESEKNLVKQKFFLEKAQEMGNIGTWEVEFKTKQFRLTNEIYRILEIPVNTKINFDSLKETIYSQDKELLLSKWEEAYKGTGFDLEHRLDINGRIKWVRQKSEPVFDDNNSLVGAVGFIQDISIQKREELVQDSLLKLIEYSTRSDINKLLTKFLDEAEELTYSNIGFFTFYDEENKNILLQTWSTNTKLNMCQAQKYETLYPLENAGVWADSIREGKTIIHNDYENLEHKNGLPEGHAPVIRELVVPVIRNENVVAVLGVGNKQTNYNNDDMNIIQRLADYAWEIVERRRVEDDLIQSRKNLAEAQRITSLGSWEFDFINKELRCSDEMYRLYEIDTFPSDHRKLLRKIHPDDWDIFKKAATDKQSNYFQYRIIRNNGSIRHIQSIRKTVLDENGHLLKVKGTCQDITRRKEAELKTIKANKKLALANNELEAFTYIVSHDLKSPVRQMASLVNLLKEISTDKLDEDEKEIIDSIGSAGEKMSLMIEELLKLSRLQKTEISREKINLAELGQSAFQTLKDAHPGKKARFVSPKKELLSSADIRLTSILLQNMIENAWKYSSNNKEIVIEIGNIEEEGQTLFFIKDYGVGFDPEKADEMFMPFRRLHSEAEFSGTGIGLSTVKKIIDLHDGKIWGESAPGQGATFFFTLEG